MSRPSLTVSLLLPPLATLSSLSAALLAHFVHPFQKGGVLAFTLRPTLLRFGAWHTRKKRAVLHPLRKFLLTATRRRRRRLTLIFRHFSIFQQTPSGKSKETWQFEFEYNHVRTKNNIRFFVSRDATLRRCSPRRSRASLGAHRRELRAPVIKHRQIQSGGPLKHPLTSAGTSSVRSRPVWRNNDSRAPS